MDSAQRRPSVKLKLPKQDYLSLIIYLGSTTAKTITLPNGRTLNRKQLAENIKLAVQEINSSLPPDEKVKNSLLNQWFADLDHFIQGGAASQVTINKLLALFQNYLKSQQPPANRPTLDQLAEWQKELAQLQAEQDQPELKAPALAGLQTQLEFIQRVKQSTTKVLTEEKHWQQLSGQEQEVVKEHLAQTLKRNLILQQQYQSAPEEFSVKNSAVVWEAVEQACQTDFKTRTAVPEQLRSSLAKKITTTLKNDDPKKLANSQEKIAAIAAKTCSATNLVHRTVQLGLSQKQARGLVKKIASLYPGFGPLSNQEIKKVISLSLAASEIAGLTARGRSINQAIEALLPITRVYYAAMPVKKIQKRWQSSPSALSQKLAQKLNFSPLTIKALLKGYTPQEFGEEIGKWQQLGVKIIRPIKLQAVGDELRQADSLIRQKRGNYPLLLRPVLFGFSGLRKISRKNRAKARGKRKLTQLSAVLNLSRQGFYQHLINQPSNPYLVKIGALDRHLKFLKNQENPGFLGIGQLIQRARLSFYRDRLKWWQKRVSKINRAPIKRFLYRLPKKLHFSYWLAAPYRFLRRGAGHTMVSLGKLLGRKNLVKAGKTTLSLGFKKLLGQGVGLAAGSILGPVGAVAFKSGAGIVKKIFQLIASPEHRRKIKEGLKNLIQPIAAITAGLTVSIASFIAQFPLLFAGAAAGMAIAGPAGAVIGGLTGYYIHKGSGFISNKLISSPAGTAELTASGRAPGMASLAPGAEAEAIAAETVKTVGTGTQTGILTSLASPAIITPVAAGALTIYTVASQGATFIKAPLSPPVASVPPGSHAITIFKNAEPQRPVTAGTTVSYTITVTSGADQSMTVSIVDDVDTGNLENFSVPEPGIFNPDQINGEISWPALTLDGAGASQTFTYTATAKTGVDINTKIVNQVTVAGSLADGSEIERQASTTLNSDGSEIAERARQIVGNLRPGFWNYYNRSPDYPELFDEDEYSCCQTDAAGNCLSCLNHCYRSSDYPSGCVGSPGAIANSEAMFWCSWLVVKAYNETGHYFPTLLGVGAMKNFLEEQGRFLPANTDVSQLEEGDTILFTAPSVNTGGSSYWAHIGIICGLGHRNDYITVCEANNHAPIIQYTVVAGQVQGQGRLTIGGFGKP